MSSHYNSLNLLKYQYKSILKYFDKKTKYEYIVINDAQKKKVYTNYHRDDFDNLIKEYCDSNNIKHIFFDQTLHINRYKLYPKNIEQDFSCVKNNPNSRCADVTQFIINKFNEYTQTEDAYLILLDSDMFFTNYFNIDTVMQDCDIVGVSQSRQNKVSYLWNGILIIKSNNMKLDELNMNCGFVNETPTDVGGYSHYYIKKYNPKIKYINSPCYSYKNTVLDSKSLPNNIKNFFLDICDIRPSGSCNKEYFLKSIVHLRGGGNWDHQGEEFMNNQNKLIEQHFNLH